MVMLQRLLFFFCGLVVARLIVVVGGSLGIGHDDGLVVGNQDAALLALVVVVFGIE